MIECFIFYCRASQVEITAGQQRAWYLGARYFHISVPLQEDKVVTCPQFADSISEGDIRWEKGMSNVNGIPSISFILLLKLHCDILCIFLVISCGGQCFNG